LDAGEWVLPWRLGTAVVGGVRVKEDPVALGERLGRGSRDGIGERDAGRGRGGKGSGRLARWQAAVR
jgi:hypothetical protein